MPYRGAWVFFIAVIVLSAIAFWPTYFSRLVSAPWTAHLHGVTAIVWVSLMAVQVYLIHARKCSFHRWIGIATIATVPLFTMGNLLVIQTLVRKRSDFAIAVGNNLAIIDVFAMLSFAWLCFMALLNRRNPALHGGYFLVTPLLLTESILTRLLTMNDNIFRLLPGEDLTEKFHFAIDISQGLAISIGGIAAWHYRKAPQPFYAIVILSAIGWAAYRLIGDAWITLAMVEQLKAMPQSLVGVIGFMVGLVSVLLGWQKGKRVRIRRKSASAQPA